MRNSSETDFFLRRQIRLGKTTLLEGLITCLKLHGLKIAIIKHAQEFKLDQKGKDSWRFREAGADPVIISFP